MVYFAFSAGMVTNCYILYHKDMSRDRRRFDRGMHFITRCDYPRMHGWWVRIWQGAPVGKAKQQKFFGDFTHGKAKALKLAKAFRDKHVPEPRRYLIHFRAKKGKLKKLPVGVCYIEYIKKQWQSGRWYEYPYCSINGQFQDDDGRQCKKRFNLATHSWDEAVRKALKFRKQGLAARL